MNITTQPLIIFTTHPGPSQHITDWVQILPQNQQENIHIYTDANSERYFLPLTNTSTKVTVISKEDLQIKNFTSLINETAKTILVGVGGDSEKNILEYVSKQHSSIEKIVYYDNLNSHIPGGYSNRAAEAINFADTVWLNARLAKTGLYEREDKSISLEGKSVEALDYFNFSISNSIREDRRDRLELRTQFLKEHGIENTECKIIPYLGGNNTTYFEESLPTLINIIEEYPSILDTNVIVLFQHPGAKAENKDAQAIEAVKKKLNPPQSKNLLVTKWDSNRGLRVADHVFFSQTSMLSHILLANVPVTEINKKQNRDIFSSGNLVPFAKDVETLKKALTESDDREPTREKTIQILNCNVDWPCSIGKLFERTLKI